MIFFWVGFLLLISLLLALDLGVFHRKMHRIKTREAILWTIFWIFLALLFDVFILLPCTSTLPAPSSLLGYSGSFDHAGSNDHCWYCPDQ
jgi:hypothetical protein